MKGSFWLIAPYAAWMVLMAVLPATVGGYAVRTAVTAAILAAGVSKVSSPLTSFVSRLKSSLLPGLLVGLAVFALSGRGGRRRLPRRARR